MSYIFEDAINPRNIFNNVSRKALLWERVLLYFAEVPRGYGAPPQIALYRFNERYSSIREAGVVMFGGLPGRASTALSQSPNCGKTVVGILLPIAKSK